MFCLPTTVDNVDNIYSVFRHLFQAFNTYKNKLIESQSVANRPQLQEAFAKLLADVHRNLESTNRDKFTQRLTSFRISVRQFLTM